MKDKISKYVTGLQESHGTQHSLAIISERWKQSIDEGEYISVMYIGSLQGFRYYNHGLFQQVL